MELLIMLLVPLPLGFFVRRLIVAYVAYIAIHGFAFTYQCLYLTLGWIVGESTAFGRYPTMDGSEVLAYGGVNLAIFVVGLCLVALGHRIAGRRRRDIRTVDLEGSTTGALHP
jgi:predicted Na+-dependent transporter